VSKTRLVDNSSALLKNKNYKYDSEIKLGNLIGTRTLQRFMNSR
jgi:hypothetical protein